MRTKELNLKTVKSNDSRIEYLDKFIQENGLDEEVREKAIKEIEKGVPVQYVVGNVNFYGFMIKVNKDVLIPRFETELLVEFAIKKIKEKFGNKSLSIIDMGTGSGCIAISIKKLINCEMDAIDISKKALVVACQNAKFNNVDINFLKANMATYRKKRYDVIIANPPYIGEDEEIMDIVKNNEPKISLYAKENGLYFYRMIIQNIPFITKEKFLVGFEIGANQGIKIEDMIKRNLPNCKYEILKDYSGFDRFIFITN